MSAAVGTAGTAPAETKLGAHLRARWNDPVWARLGVFDRPGWPAASGFVLIGDAADPRAPHVAMMLAARDAKGR